MLPRFGFAEGMQEDSKPTSRVSLTRLPSRRSPGIDRIGPSALAQMSDLPSRVDPRWLVKRISPPVEEHGPGAWAAALRRARWPHCGPWLSGMGAPCQRRTHFGHGRGLGAMSADQLHGLLDQGAVALGRAKR